MYNNAYQTYPVQNPDDRFLGSFILGGLAGGALGYGIANNNDNNTYYPVYPMMPYPMYQTPIQYPTYPTYQTSNNYYY